MTSYAAILLALAAMALAAAGLRRRATPMAARIDAVLPQTQCRQCGFDGCRPYAEAIARGEALNRCPPGGSSVIARIARITGRGAVPLDISRGAPKPPQRARIDEAACIGCTLCIQACPVDAIVGAPKLMHTVIAEHCTGCELCLPPCPVDCIELVPHAPGVRVLLPFAARVRADSHRVRFERRSSRLERERRAHAERMAAKAARTDTAASCTDTAAAGGDAEARKRAIVAQALARARARLAAGQVHR
jgi:electron transport complex protein RnfB